MKKILYFLIILLGLASLQVKAETYEGKIYLDTYIVGNYLKFEKNGKLIKYTTAQFTKRSSDNSPVYCLEPYVVVSSNTKYAQYTTDIPKILDISNATWNRIAALAYYGYNYKDATHDHTAEKWWIITQYLIWQESAPDSDIYFTKTLNGERDDTKYQDEIAELEELVTNILTPPELVIPSTLIGNAPLTKSASQLKNYQIMQNTGNKVELNDGNITLSNTNEGLTTFSLSPKVYYHEQPTLYYSLSSQKVVHPGDLTHLTYNYSYRTIQPSLKITKKSLDNQTLLPNAHYGIYQLNNQKVGELVTNQNGEAVFDKFLELGDYYFQEEIAPNGYVLDLTKHYFTLKEDTYHLEFTLNNELLKGKIKIHKQSSYDLPLTNAQYEIRDSKNNLVETLTINENNEAVSSLLPYGTYTIKEITPPTGYLLDTQTYEVTITENNHIYEITSTEPIIQGQIKIHKHSDYDIPLTNAQYEIRDSKNNLMETLTINENNEAASSLLPYGTYTIKEITPPTGYLLDTQTYEITITENNHIYEITSTEPIILGNLKILKLDEETLKPIHNTKFKIYNSQDELLYEMTTDDFGIIYLNDLPYGNYYLIEDTPNPDYLPNHQVYWFQIVENKALEEIIIYNQHLPMTPPTPGIPQPDIVETPEEKEEPIPDEETIIPVPDTAVSCSYLLFIGVGLYCYGKKKNN